MTNAMPKAATYSVVVRDPNSWSASTGIHHELANCGHDHRSLAAQMLVYAERGLEQDKEDAG